MTAIMNINSSLVFLLLVLFGCALTDTSISAIDVAPGVELPVNADPPVDDPEDVQGAASEVVAVAEPNIAALLGIGALAGNAGLLAGIRNQGGLIPGGERSSAAQTTPDLSSLCSSNSDALTNLLVYQYLSGSIPAGGNGLPNNLVNAVPTDSIASSNPHIQPLSIRASPTKTSISISTTLTTRIITMEPSTTYYTSTTSYTTTVTQITSSILPIIFRGSKLITTITDRTTEVLVATEYKTSSVLNTPSIVHTLAVEITHHHLSTIGHNGQFSLDSIAAGATRVLEKPIATSKVNFDDGLNLSSLDITSLTALIDQYGDQDEEPEIQRERFNPRRNEPQQDRRQRFRDRQRPDRAKQFVEEPKFNVLSGFTYSDRPATSQRKAKAKTETGTGTASLSTRYSKFRKKTPLKNNNVSPQESDRESEPYSATTSRRTISSPNENRPPRRSLPRSRFFNKHKSKDRDLDRQASSVSGVRRHREIDIPMRRTGRTIRKDTDPFNNYNQITPSEKSKKSFAPKTTVLTMYMTGPRPGQTVSIERTITIRNTSPLRYKRNAVTVQPSEVIKSIPTSRQPDPMGISPQEVVSLLKGLKKSKVTEMLTSLQKWVDFYMRNMVDDPEQFHFLNENHISPTGDAFSDLIASYDRTKSNSNRDATVTLPSTPRTVTAHPTVNSVQLQQCPSPVTLTETVFKTIYSE